jgi:hypothetical protein
MDALLELARASRIPIQHDLLTTVADVAIQFWLVAPDLLRDRHAEAVAFRQKNYLYFAADRQRPAAFPRTAPEQRREVEETLDNWFEQHQRGRGCRVLYFPDGQKTWIVIRHGQRLRREASHQDDGGSSTQFYRPEQHDVLVYDAEWGEMAVHASTKREIKLYLSCFGRLLFGDERYFPAACKFTLEPLTVDGAKSLWCEDIDGLERVRLVEYRCSWGGAFQEIETRRATDIFAAFESRGMGLQGVIVAAVFKVKFTGVRKERSVTIRPGAIAKYERNEDNQLIERWLANRGFIVKPDYDQAAEPVLEAA